MTMVLPFPAARARWALVTAPTGPKLEIAACCASRSVIPMARPAAAVSRRWSSASARIASASPGSPRSPRCSSSR